MSDGARGYLESLQRFDLALLLRGSEFEIKQVRLDSWLEDLTEEAVVVSAPAPVAEALTLLPQHDRKRIAEAIVSCVATSKPHDNIQIETSEGGVESQVALLAELVIHRGMMISVATGGQRIQDVNDYFIARTARLRASLPNGVP